MKTLTRIFQDFNLRKKSFRHSLYLSLQQSFTILSQQQVQFYQNCGYLQLDNIVSDQEIEALQQRSREIIDEQDPYEEQTEFKSGSKSRDESFINSGDKIKLFFEPNVFDENKRLKVEHHLAYNKMGHAMHDLDKIFSKFCYQKKFGQILESLNYINPALVQTMYIYKNPFVGQRVDPHTDNTYLITEPRLSTIAIWIALDDATLINGCLWGVPGSHHQQTTQFFYVDSTRTSTYFHNPTQSNNIHLTYALPLEVKKGGCLIFSGDFVHFSKDNTSDLQRHAFTMHFVDLHQNKWSTHNWLQRPSLPFKNYYQSIL